MQTGGITQPAKKTLVYSPRPESGFCCCCCCCPAQIAELRDWIWELQVSGSKKADAQMGGLWLPRRHGYLRKNLPSPQHLVKDLGRGGCAQTVWAPWPSMPIFSVQARKTPIHPSKPWDDAASSWKPLASLPARTQAFPPVSLRSMASEPIESETLGAETQVPGY